MKIHEYQGKKIFSDYGMPVQDGYIFEKIEDAEKTIKRVQKDFNTQDVVVKAQIHAGGRGKGGGVKYSSNFEDALENAKSIGLTIDPDQTAKQFGFSNFEDFFNTYKNSFDIGDVTLEEAKEIKNKDIANALDLPPIKIHCSVLAEDSIHKAIEDYESKI